MKHNQNYHADWIERFICSECDFMSPDESKVKCHQENRHQEIEDKDIRKVNIKNSIRSECHLFIVVISLCLD